MLECLYDPYINSGRVKFSYGQPFSYFSEPVKQPPPGFSSDLNTNAMEFNPTNPLSTVSSNLQRPIIICSENAKFLWVT
jgi:hypothetical protein